MRIRKVERYRIRDAPALPTFSGPVRRIRVDAVFFWKDPELGATLIQKLGDRGARFGSAEKARSRQTDKRHLPESG